MSHKKEGMTHLHNDGQSHQFQRLDTEQCEFWMWENCCGQRTMTLFWASNESIPCRSRSSIKRFHPGVSGTYLAGGHSREYLLSCSWSRYSKRGGVRWDVWRIRSNRGWVLAFRKRFPPVDHGNTHRKNQGNDEVQAWHDMEGYWLRADSVSGVVSNESLISIGCLFCSVAWPRPFFGAICCALSTFTSHCHFLESNEASHSWIHHGDGQRWLIIW